MNVTDETNICMIAGTWSINEYPRRAPITDGLVLMNSLFCLPGYYLIEESSPTSAGNNQWFIDRLLPELKAEAKAAGKSIYDILNDWVDSFAPGDFVPVFLPFLTASNVDPRARAAFVGLNASHSRREMARAVYEGITFSHRYHLDRLMRSRPDRSGTIRLAGGAARSKVWTQMFADVMDMPVETVSAEETGALGCCVAGAAALGNELLLVTPGAVARRLGELIVTADFWATLGFTFSRISLGFLLALALAGILAALSAAVPFIETLLRPYVAAIQSVPVASFIVIAFLWLSARRLSTFIAFLMVFPVLYTNLLQGIRAADRNLLEMADVFRLSPGRRVRCIFLPALRPALFAGCRVALGLCWKAGVAAEVIGVVARSVGGKLYDAKAYLEIADLFAWTVVIVAVSALFERVFLFLLGKIFDALEHAV